MKVHFDLVNAQHISYLFVMEYDLVLALPVKVVVNLAVADAFDLL